MKVEVAVLGSRSLTVLVVSVCGRRATLNLSLNHLLGSRSTPVILPLRKQLDLKQVERTNE